MDLIKQKGEKVGPIKDVCHKFKYSFQGLAYCFKNETSFTFEAIAIVGLVILGIIFKLSIIEWVICIVSLLLIMEIELLNTGIEATVDMFTKEFNPFAKIAKDCGSAATCLATFSALIVNLTIFIPKFIAFFAK